MGTECKYGDIVPHSGMYRVTHDWTIESAVRDLTRRCRFDLFDKLKTCSRLKALSIAEWAPNR